MAARAEALLAPPQDFSVVLGGPLYQLFRQAHLSGDALEQARHRIIVVTAFLWVPLLILSLWQGLALGTSVAIPFLRDIEAQARFLLLVPLLIAAELLVHQRLRTLTSQFLRRGLIPDDAQARFDEAVASTIRLRNSVVAEVAMLVFVYALGLRFSMSQHAALETATWYAAPSADGWTLSRAGYWYVYVALPLTQFLLLRWYYRIFIWARFLWQTSRINLRLVATHPDQVGGLGFLATSTAGFTPLAVAHGAFVSGWIASRIFLHHAALLEFKFLIIAIAVWMLILFLGPFLVFSPQLARARRQGELDYGPLAGRYVQEFDAKWVRAGAPPSEPLLGSADVQSLADMGNAYAIVKRMRSTPITRQAVVQIGVATLAPIAPLALTMMPLAEIAKLLFGILT